MAGVLPSPFSVVQAVGTIASCSMVSGVYTCVSAPGGGPYCITDENGQTSCVDGSGNNTTSSSGTGALGRGLGSITSSPVVAAGTGWLSKLTGWIAYAINTVFKAVIGLLRDLVTYVLGVVFDLVSTAINAIGVPSWISNFSLGSLLGQTGSIVGFFMVQLQIPAGLGLIGLGYAFRLLRKFLTLFQW